MCRFGDSGLFAVVRSACVGTLREGEREIGLVSLVSNHNAVTLTGVPVERTTSARTR